MNTTEKLAKIARIDKLASEGNFSQAYLVAQCLARFSKGRAKTECRKLAKVLLSRAQNNFAKTCGQMFSPLPTEFIDIVIS